MAGLLRDSCRLQPRRPSRKSCTRALVEYVPVGRLPPQSLLDQLVCDMQRHLEEMERVRAVLLDAYPCLASTSAAAAASCPRTGGGGGALGGRRGSRRAQQALDTEDDDGGYQFSVDVAGFAPEELAVKLEGRTLTVSGKHDQQAAAADGCVSREYREVRKEVRLPADAQLDAVACTFSPEAECLCIEAPRQAPPTSPERTIPISLAKPLEVAPPAPAASLPPAPLSSLPPAKEAPIASPQAAAAPAA